MPTAYCLVRRMPHYRYDAFVAGLERLGYTIKDFPANASKIKPDDVLIVWNRYGAYDAQAKHFSRVGAAVLVAENGYLPMRDTQKAIALSLTHHNGAGSWPMCAGRSERLKVMLSPWRQDGGHILLLPQRGIGPPGVAQPRDWLSDIQRRLGKRKIHVRKHPGTDKTAKPLQEDLQDARCAIVWGSGAGLKALCAGVPVFYDFPKWIGRFAASRDLMRIDDSDLTAAMGDRHAMLEQIASAQWAVEEIADGTPFIHLLALHDRQKSVAKSCA